ncbi:MAG: HEPN domain-containing protein [Firmicutes bacterium]|jgi:HEPN domain-containing protein|nr:HEPN domain-containing protein [Bacillota bacterium]MCL5066268.1 HEPN domain-containing protein [Bacillota bacterium]
MANPAVAEWLSLAERDLEAARVLSNLPNQRTNACFHAQQAAEKAMKALYAMGGLIPPRIHDLDVLRERLGDAHDLSEIAIACAVLSMYAVDSRYPGAVVEEEEVGPALAFSEEVMKTVRRVIEAKQPEDT